jgi:hypothetical protein
VLWSFSHNEEITAADGKKIWAARQHHDWQREDFPAGYYHSARSISHEEP